VGVEHARRPVRRGESARDQVRRRDRVLVDEGLLLRRQRGCRLLVAAAVDDDRQPPR
jgi:hypothetical protein